MSSNKSSKYLVNIYENNHQFFKYRNTLLISPKTGLLKWDQSFTNMLTNGNQDCLDNYKLQNVPPTAYYISGFITADEETAVLSNIYAAPKPKWTQLSNRRLQNWGGIPHTKGMIAETIPAWLDDYLGRIDQLNVMSGIRPNHVLVNEYLPGQGIMPHLDGTLFYPTITTVSVGAHTVLKFFEPTAEDKSVLQPKFSFLLEPRSLLILQDKLFHDYLHCIEELHEDSIDNNIANLDMCSKDYELGMKCPRTTRISLTIRHVPKTTTFKLNIGSKR